MPDPRPVTARSRLRPKAQLTLPGAIRAALRIKPGDEVEFTVGEDGTVTARGWTLVPADRVRPDAGAGGQRLARAFPGAC